MTTTPQRIVARYLRTAVGLGLGKTWENKKVRVHRYATSFKVWDLTNAGKRGKKVRVMVILPNTYSHNEEEAWLKEQSRYVLLNAAQGYDSIKNYFEQLGGSRIEERQERGIDVLPGDTKKIDIQWKHGEDILDLSATPLKFSLKSSAPLRHHTTGEDIGRQDTLYWPLKKVDAKRFYAWLASEGEGQVKRMNITSLRKLWQELGIQYDYH